LVLDTGAYWQESCGGDEHLRSCPRHRTEVIGTRHENVERG
jgi:hypothetical protein